MSALGFVLARALTVVRCAACDQPLRTRAVFCAPCAATVLRAEPTMLLPPDPRVPGLPLEAFGLYGGALADAVRALKYRSRPDLAGKLGALLCAIAPEADVVVPVPLHPRRLAERGYNQAALIARPLARHLRAPLAATALGRRHFAAPQASLDRAARMGIAEAFCLRDQRALAGRRVLLVDDVATTGATLTACARQVVVAGARSVAAIVVARAERVHVTSDATRSR